MPSSGQVASLLESAVSADGDRSAVAYGDAVISYRELNVLVDRLASELHVGPGERIAVIGPNTPALVSALFAAWKLGAVAVPLSGRLRGFELGRAFSSVRPTAAVYTASHGRALAQEMASLQDETPTLAECVVMDPLGDVADRRRQRAEQAERLSEETGAILHTSGTSGEPKGALMPHSLLQAHCENMPPVLGDVAATSCALAVPATHSFGLGCMLCTLAARGTLVLADVSTSVEPLVNMLQRLQARVLHGSPALFARLVDAAPELPIKRGFMAGASCPPTVLQRFDQRGVRVLNLYGMTEIGAATCCRTDDPPEVRYTTAGRSLCGQEVRVAPLDGEDTEVGEIQVRGPMIHPGYLSRPWTSDETAGDGWFRTGDLGSIDAAGNLSVVGRSKEVFQVGGFNVFPAEVETFLLTHPSIVQAVVIGAPHSVMGEVPHAFVVPRGDVEVKPSDIIRFARENIAGYKVPYAVHIRDELPTLPSGKADRKELVRVLMRAHGLD